MNMLSVCSGRFSRRSFLSVPATCCAVAAIALILPWPALGQAPTPGAPSAEPPPVQAGDYSPTLYLPLSATIQLGNLGDLKLPTLSLPVSLPLTVPGVFAATKLAAQPPPATLTLAYNPLYAGARAVVAPLDGGTLTGADADHLFTIGSDGKLVFSFQPPASPGRYHVLVQLGGSAAAFSFDVASPASATP